VAFGSCRIKNKGMNYSSRIKTTICLLPGNPPDYLRFVISSLIFLCTSILLDIDLLSGCLRYHFEWGQERIRYNCCSITLTQTQKKPKHQDTRDGALILLHWFISSRVIIKYTKFTKNRTHKYSWCKTKWKSTKV